MFTSSLLTQNIPALILQSSDILVTTSQWHQNIPEPYSDLNHSLIVTSAHYGCCCLESGAQRYTEITHDPPLFSVAQGIFWLSTERLSHSTLHLKEGVEGSPYSCTLQSCNCDILHRPLCADKDKIPEGRSSTYILLFFQGETCVKIHLKMWVGGTKYEGQREGLWISLCM